MLADYRTNSLKNIYASYQHAILDADVVLPDGIALQIFNALATKKWLNNLNGTDFCPYFLSYLKKKYHQKPIDIILYGTHPHLLEKTQQLLTHQ
ncbi:MAG: WecB/TagA/CpsF family glycosyltransferase [bacterium]